MPPVQQALTFYNGTDLDKNGKGLYCFEGLNNLGYLSIFQPIKALQKNLKLQESFHRQPGMSARAVDREAASRRSRELKRLPPGATAPTLRALVGTGGYLSAIQVAALAALEHFG